MTDRSLTFVSNGLYMAASVLLVLVTTLFCFLAWRRSGYARATGFLEAMRLLLVTLVAVSLNQPELLEQYRPQRLPALAVLWDNSRSMETRDVPESADAGGELSTRGEAIEPWIQSEFWAPLADQFDVDVQPFAASSASPAEGTDLSGALRAALDHSPHLQGIVLFSDGDWNLGEPPAKVASDLRIKNVSVFAVAVGSETRLPDIELSQVNVPTFGMVGKSLQVPFTIDSSLPQDYDAEVSLHVSGQQQETRSVRIPAMGHVEDSLSWTPDKTGDYTLRVSVPAHRQEVVLENNDRELPISIREEALRVLLVESYPRWEYRYLRNALERDPGVEVHCLLFHPDLENVGGGRGYLDRFPETLEELAEYDVVFLGDVGVGEGQLTSEHCRLLKGFVQGHAGGLILMPGFSGRHFSLADTDLDELYPVVLDSGQPRGWGSRVPSQMELTQAGRQSLLTKLVQQEDDNARLWETLPGFQWHAPILRAKAGSDVLATHKTEGNRYGRIPLLVTKSFGTGKVLFMGTDGAWRWREGVEDRYHYRFWGQVARWMAYQRNMAHGESMRLFYSPDRPRAGDAVTLFANVMAPGGEPLQEGTVTVQILSPSGKTESVGLSPAEGEWGLFVGTFSPPEAGTYELALHCRETEATLETKLAVEGVVRERIGQPVRKDVLREVAELTGGRLLELSECPALLEQIASLPEPEPMVRRLRIWCHPLWAGLLVLLLGIFWTGRKLAGTI